MPRIISKGDIFWGRTDEPSNSHMLHPIVVMESVDFGKKLPDTIKAVILSTKNIKKSIAENVEMSRYHFEWMSPKGRPYKIKVNRNRKEYLVNYGFLKCPMSLHVHEKGKLTSIGISFVEKVLQEHNVKEFEYLPFTIKELNTLRKSKRSPKK